jgi:protein tyrosine/serine phosphatase
MAQLLRFASFFVLFPTLLAPRPPAEEPGEGDIPRFGILSEGLYRGGQPTAQGFQFLKQKGIRTIINFRAEDNSEEPIVQELRMNYIRIPVDEVRPWSKLPEGAIAKYFELVNNPANYPIFFHCRRGADRTGAFAALYRMALQRWDADKAYKEARDIGMRWYFGGLKSQIYDFKPPVVSELQPAMKSEPR